MSALGDIVSRVIEACQDDTGSLVTHRAVTMGVPLVKGDPELVDLCIGEALGRRIKEAATRARRVAEEAPDSEVQPSLHWGDKLKPRYAIDIDGRILKNTRSLSRLEFERVRQIRREQIRADSAALAVLDEAGSALSLIWDVNPALSFGEVERIYLAVRAAAD